MAVTIQQNNALQKCYCNQYIYLQNLIETSLSKDTLMKIFKKIRSVVLREVANIKTYKETTPDKT